ncbi:MAG: hypothetical protein WCW04_00015 [Candidatus Paceibacterota bacterium]
MHKNITISYQNRQGNRRDLASVPKIIIANHLLEESGFLIGDKVDIEYLSNQIIIKKLTQIK